MSLALSSSPLALASSTSTAAAAASTAAAAAPLSSLLSAMANDRRWVGSAWILSSAVLTTYSTTKFLKYRGEEDEDVGAMMTSTSSRAPSVRERFSSVLNSTRKEEPAAIVAATERGDDGSGATSRRRTEKPMSRASLLTLYRFSGSLLLGLLLHSRFYRPSALLSRLLRTARSARLFLLPSLLLFVANYSNSVALERIGISLTYTSKCGIPLVTVLLTLLLDGRAALPSNATLLSLLPIAAGIGAASWNAPNFEPLGMLAAATSTASQAGLNVASKRVMRATGTRGAEAQRAMVFVALGIGLALTGANRTQGRTHGEEEGEGGATAPESSPPPWLTCLAVLAYHAEYVLSFSFVSLVDPITYGTCDALRRLLIIVVGNRMFRGDRFTKTNLGGIFTALVGALMYSITSAKGGGAMPKPRSI